MSLTIFYYIIFINSVLFIIINFINNYLYKIKMLSKKLCKFLIQSKSYTNYWIIIIGLEYKYQKTLYDFFQYFFNYFSFFIFFLTFFIENFINFYIMHSLLFSSIALNHKLSFRINMHVHLSFEYIVKDITTHFVQRQLI